MRPSGLLLAGSALFLACAQVKQITGGEKDTTPPSLTSAAPPNGSIRFNSDVIRLEFDERIQLDRVRDRLLISPPLDEAPKVRIAGARGMVIELNAPLKPNTTYTFNLGESVKDLTEGNTSPSLSYVFTTGEALDSLSIVGAVVNAFTGSAEKDMFVLLYAANDTTSFQNGRPAYMARCDALGVFSIDHLPPGAYQVLALRDKNANYRYDLPNEEIAFLDTVQNLSANDTAVPVLTLRSFLPPSTVQSVRGYKVIPDGALQVVLSRSMDTLIVQDIARTGGSLSWRREWNTTRDTVLLWPSDTTLLTEGIYAIGDGMSMLDTLRYRPLQRMPFNTELSSVTSDDESGTTVRLRSSRPLASLDTSRIILGSDSTRLAFTTDRAPDQRTILLRTTITPGSHATLTLLPRCVRDIYGGTNDTVRIALGRAMDQALGSLRVEIDGLRPKGRYLLQLLDGQQRIMRETSTDQDSSSIHWDRLTPGPRTLRLIEDTNANGRWDTGDWETRLQPERTWYYSGPVNIRAAWDIVVEWDLE